MIRRTAVTTVLLSAVLVAPIAPVAADPGTEPAVAPLPLGPADLPQSSTVHELAPGVTLTEIDRGAVDPATGWVVEVSIPAGETSPDPDAPPRAIQDRASAEDLATELDAAGFPAAAQPVRQPRLADVPAGLLGYRVRLIESFPTEEAAAAADALVTDAGFSARAWYTGWDGGSDVAAHWRVNVLTIDPRTFRGELGASYGPDLQDRETTSELGAGAVAAVNAGFFVLDPRAGAPGDPAGVGAYDGVVESETVAGRPALVLDARAHRTDVVRPQWSGTVHIDRQRIALDGINRVPGLIRNCGGVGDDPTDLPLHDVTCTDPDELVAFTGEFGDATPSGDGAEVIIDRRGRVVDMLDHRGAVLLPGQRSLQATGDRTDALAGVRVGDRILLRTTLTDGTRRLDRPGVTVVNGGPELLRNGRLHITQQRDGMVHPDDPSFAYGWVLQRNPRTFAGVDDDGRTMLVTVDGRQLDQAGLSIPETAAVARALGLRSAINLDGGGSTTMVVDGQLISHPSDAAGERPVGDAIVIR